MRIGIGIHSHGQGIDRQRLNNFLITTRPDWNLVLDDLDYAKKVRELLPNSNVIFREHGDKGDETIHLQKTPEEWVTWKKPQLAQAPGVWMHTSNEPPFDAKVLQWHIRLMKLCVKERIPLVVGSWAVGVTPKPEELPNYPDLKEFLQLLDEHRDLFVLGLHEYGCGVLTSGLVGGAPDDPAHPNYIFRTNWPESTRGLTKFHCGRFEFLTNYARSLGLRAPRIVLTEHGLDDLSDIKFWSQTLKVKSGYLNIRGWKTLTDQWNDWYSKYGWSPEQAYFEMLKWADKAIYQNTEVEGQIIFSWGYSSGDWDQFNISEAFTLQQQLALYAFEQPVPKPGEPPTNIGMPMKVVLLHDTPLCAAPQGAAIETLPAGTVGILYGIPETKVGNYSWRWFQREGAQTGGFVRFTDLQYRTWTPEPPPPDPEKPTTRTIKITIEATDPELAELATSYMQVMTNFAQYVELWQSLKPSIVVAIPQGETS